MKTISIRQPWLWAIMHAGKCVENRRRHDGRMPYFMRHRGPLALHASANDSPAYWNASIAELRTLTGRQGTPTPDEVPRAAIVAVADVIAHVDPHGMLHFEPDDKSDGFELLEGDHWHDDGAWGFVLRNVRAVKPLPRKGALGLFETPDHLLEVL